MKSTLAADGQRRHSVAAASNRTSPKEGKKSRNEDHDNAMRRKSILAAASLKARQLNTDSRSTSSTSNGSIGEKKKTPIEVLSTRRMSRTENLKDGLPTSPSMAAKITTRRKSLLKQQEEAKKSSANPTTVPMTRKRGKVRKKKKNRFPIHTVSLLDFTRQSSKTATSSVYSITSNEG